MTVAGQAAPNAQGQFEQTRNVISRAVHGGRRIDPVGPDLRRSLLASGRSLPRSYVARRGDRGVGPQVTTPEGDTVRRPRKPRHCRYVPIVGESTIPRVA